MPLPIPPQGAGVPTCCVLGGLNGSFPLGKAGMGPLCWSQKAPPQFPFLGKPERGLSLLSLSLWGELERGFWGVGEGLLGFSLVCIYDTIFIHEVV